MTTITNVSSGIDIRKEEEISEDRRDSSATRGKMLELEVVPEHGLTSDHIEFILGTHFSLAVASIQSHMGNIKGVEISYCNKDPLAFDLNINLTRDGIKLVFDSVSQRLKVIELYDLSLVRLKYCDLMFNCPQVLPTIEQIDQTFGATRPGVYDEEKKRFTLTFRGLAFEFPAETSFQPSYGGSKRELGRLQFPPGESPTVSHMAIYSGSSVPIPGPSSSSPPAPISRLPSLSCRGVKVVREDKRTVGLLLSLEPNLGEVIRSSFPPEAPELQGNTATQKMIRFGDSVQDVMSSIGSPSRVFYKSEDKMKIHSPNAHRKTISLKSDYFYNYFNMGMDILFDAKHNKVKKFIMHTNFPGHYNFNMYHRCEFSLELDTSSHQMVLVSPLSKWDSVSSNVKVSERPVVLNRASSTNTTNPFGSTFCYGYQDIIFEVMPNGHIASVTLYLPSDVSPRG